MTGFVTMNFASIESSRMVQLWHSFWQPYLEVHSLYGFSLIKTTSRLHIFWQTTKRWECLFYGKKKIYIMHSKYAKRKICCEFVGNKFIGWTFYGDFRWEKNMANKHRESGKLFYGYEHLQLKCIQQSIHSSIIQQCCSLKLLKQSLCWINGIPSSLWMLLLFGNKYAIAFRISCYLALWSYEEPLNRSMYTSNCKMSTLFLDFESDKV